MRGDFIIIFPCENASYHVVTFGCNQKQWFISLWCSRRIKLLFHGSLSLILIRCLMYLFYFIICLDDTSRYVYNNILYDVTPANLSITFISCMMSHQLTCRSPLSIMSVPDEGYSRNASCSLNLISKFLFISLTVQ
jgi:hypothetical protein